MGPLLCQPVTSLPEWWRWLSIFLSCGGQNVHRWSLCHKHHNLLSCFRTRVLSPDLLHCPGTCIFNIHR